MGSSASSVNQSISQSVNQSPWWIVHLSALPGCRPLQKDGNTGASLKSELLMVTGGSGAAVCYSGVESGCKLPSCALKSAQSGFMDSKSGEKTSFSSPDFFHVKILCFIESHVFFSFKIIRNSILQANFTETEVVFGWRP